MRPKLYQALNEAGIYSCELNLPGCQYGMFPTLAHAMKRREIESLEDLEDVVWLCQRCHQFVEALGDRKIITMEMVIHKLQENRIIKVCSIF